MLQATNSQEEAAAQYDPQESAEPCHVDYLMAGSDNEDEAAVHVGRLKGGPSAKSSQPAKTMRTDQHGQDDDDEGDEHPSDEERTSPTHRPEWYTGALELTPGRQSTTRMATPSLSFAFLYLFLFILPHLFSHGPLASSVSFCAPSPPYPIPKRGNMSHSRELQP